MTARQSTTRTKSPFRTLDAGRRAGRVPLYCLGIGIDALNYVGDLFTVAVFDADIFDDLFDGMVEQNDEGGVDSEQFRFDEPTVQRLFADGDLAPKGGLSAPGLAPSKRDLGEVIVGVQVVYEVGVFCDLLF